MFDKEIVDDFKQQLAEFDNDFEQILSELSDNCSQPDLFVRSGQIVDRIFGAISMFGLAEFSNYIRTMKEVCYKCSRSESEVAHKKVYEQLIDCREYLRVIGEKFDDEEELKKLNFKINLSLKKAEKLLVSYFHSIKEASVSYDGGENFILVFDKSSELEIQAKESKKIFVPALKFHNAPGGFKKDLKDEKVPIVGAIIDTSCSANIWMDALKMAHEHRPALPVILISKKPSELSSFNKEDIGVVEILSSKAGLTKIVDALKELKEAAAEKHTTSKSSDENGSSNFIEVSSSSFKLCLESPYDIFIKVGDKHIKVVEKGNAFNEEQLQRQYDKGVFSYRVREDDYSAFLNSFNNEIARVLSDSSLDIDAKKIHFSDFGEEIHRSMTIFGVDNNRLDSAKEFVDHSDKLLNEMTGNSKSVQDLVLDLASVEHSISVCFIIGLFLKEIGAKKEIYDDIMLAGFLHDIGLIGASKAARSEVVSNMNDDDKRVYYDHPKKGSDLLRELNLKNAIIEAVHHHHMKANGNGFPPVPKGTASSINRIGELIGIAEDIAIEIQQSSDKSQCPIEKIRLTLSENYSPTIIAAFNVVFPKAD